VDAPGQRNAEVVGTRVLIVTIESQPRDTVSQKALVAGSARVPIITCGPVQQLVPTTVNRVATVQSALVAVVTIHLFRAGANPGQTQVAFSALVAIVAIPFHRHRHTSTRIAAALIRSTRVAVVAGKLPFRHALALQALVTRRAQITIIAGSAVECSDAAQHRVALTVCARVVVSARLRTAGYTLPFRTIVAIGTGIPVIARQGVGGKDTQTVRAAGVVSADIPIVTHLRRPGCTHTILALIIQGARVAISARSRNRIVPAPAGRKAVVLGARVTIIAVRQLAGEATPALTLVNAGALVSVIAQDVVSHVSAPYSRCTLILSADVVVITCKFPRPDTYPRLTLIRHGANVTVVTRQLVVDVDTPLRRVTGIIRAQVAIVAVDGPAGNTLALHATVVDGAQVPVVAKHPFVVRQNPANPRVRIARRLQTKSMCPFRLRAGDDCCFVNHTLVGELLRIALESTVAQVAIVKPDTVVVSLAITVHRDTLALLSHTLISQRTRIAVVAKVPVGLKYTAPRLSAMVVRAHVSVIAIDHRANAHPAVAVVGYGTRIAVGTLANIQGLVDTSQLPFAGIVGTLVFIVAKLGQRAFPQRRLIHISITVVVDAVTLLGSRDSRIARSQPFGSAQTHAGANTPLVVRLTRGPETLFD